MVPGIARPSLLVLGLITAACQPVIENPAAPAIEPWLQPVPPSGPVSTMGRLGAINTPTARMAEAGTIRLHTARREPYWVAGVTVQPLSRLELTYRRTVDNRSASERGFRFSGGLDAKAMLVREGPYAPQLSLGIDAIAGNGIFGAEYLVASKRVGPLDLSLGLGWGRLAGGGPLSNGFSLIGGHFDKPSRREEFDRGPDEWFSGNRVGLFGSASYQLPWSLPWLPEAEKPRLILEYDSDQYWAEQRFDPGFDPGRIPVNIGLETALGSGFRAGISSERFKTLSARLSWSWNPIKRHQQKPLQNSFRQPQHNPAPVTDADYEESPPLWLDATTVPAGELASAILDQGIAAAHARPDSETITTSIGNQGLPVSSLTMRSTDLRKLASGDASPEEVWHNSESRSSESLPDTAETAGPAATGLLDHLHLTLAPETIIDGFEASSGVVARQSLLFDARYAEQKTRIGASLRLNMADNLDRLTRDRGFTTYPVRSNLEAFADNRLWIDRAYYGTAEHIAPDLYIGGVAGLLEEQFGGISTQVLYWPHDAKWAIGGHLTQAYARDQDQLLNAFTDQVLTAELSGYYHFPGGLMAKAGLVRYLGTDVGLALDFSQPLGDGWMLDGYLTFSDADERSSQRIAQFAETGGADFGLRLRVPIGSVLNSLVSIEPRLSIRALGRDQAQRLVLPYTLYDQVAPAHMNAVVKSWPGLTLH